MITRNHNRQRNTIVVHASVGRPGPAEGALTDVSGACGTHTCAALTHIAGTCGTHTCAPLTHIADAGRVLP